ncbi:MULTISPECIES: thioredoxin-dependent thiol peroxidase [unclassified Porphyromonas]|uniref:thioredoxin-dependent thiol peroxidase n=1 Tax=unclassified Porphyromonas TaxID=2645799 RepID=UPI00052E19AF|nr:MULTISPECIES: thioredoxin-dependent thiol peroxidase [unclassified Porphyromonas]KGN81987.1 thiol peroxidase [Porphyromonas sp. COT-290 OH860]KGO01140.1 thiol peroxidase [Porphyromonas sp. COT-290 OH3588]
MMNIGDRVEDLLGLDQDGREVRLSDYPDRKVVLYFYPKDNTAGCTAQACSLRDGYAELRAAGYEVVGVSRDTAKSHRGFIDKHSLPFRLIADTDVRLNEQFGVWVEKSMYGRKYMGTERTSFVIGTDGRIERIIRGRAVVTADHAAQILAEQA